MVVSLLWSYNYMKDFAKDFYLSAGWRRAREYIYQRDYGICVKCCAPGEIVHHREPITPSNMTDVTIALGADNLELLCRECHSIEHTDNYPVDKSLMFDEAGNLLCRAAVL